MPVRIEKISVRNLGPVAEFNMELGALNLIYGRNEQGKTCLVEFILKCLFKVGRQWDLRDLSPRGKVVISGLEEQAVSFSLSTRPKLDERWAGESPAMPQNMANLLVVKGAELAMDRGARGGAGRNILKNYVSGEGVLDAVQSRISATVQDADVKSPLITGPSRGEIKTRNDQLQRIGKIDALFAEVDRVCSGAVRESLRKELRALDDSMAEQEKARRHYAFRLGREIAELDMQVLAVPEDRLNFIGEDIRVRDSKSLDYQRKRQNADIATEKRRHYSWLKQCLETYRERSGRATLKRSPIFIALSAVLFVCALVCTVFGIKTGAVLAIFAGAVFGWLHVRGTGRAMVVTAADKEELSKVAQGFKERFGEELSDEAVIQARLEDLELAGREAGIIEHDLDDLKTELDSLSGRIASELSAIAGKSIREQDWQKMVSSLREQVRGLRSRREEKARRLAALGVDEIGYLAEDSGTEYDAARLNEIKGRLTEIRNDIVEEDARLGNVKARVSQETGGTVSESWENLVQKLKDKRAEEVAGCKSLTAEIIAGVMISKAIENLREKEDERIREGLQSPSVLETLKKVTGRYVSIVLEGDEVVAADQYDAFKLGDLSTGAQQQVLLALRMGFASRITGQDSLFLILDDAFQYSDWKHREVLVDEAVSMSQNGWQIVYLTMDDHIRDLFLEKGKLLGDEFVFTELGSDL